MYRDLTAARADKTQTICRVAVAPQGHVFFIRREENVPLWGDRYAGNRSGFGSRVIRSVNA
jgi:hypothetical protein